jgi:hypothetical protein
VGPVAGAGRNKAAEAIGINALRRWFAFPRSKTGQESEAGSCGLKVRKIMSQPTT